MLFLTFLSISVAMHVTAHDACVTRSTKFNISQHSSHKSPPVAQKIIPAHIETSACALQRLRFHFTEPCGDVL